MNVGSVSARPRSHIARMPGRVALTVTALKGGESKQAKAPAGPEATHPPATEVAPSAVVETVAMPAPEAPVAPEVRLQLPRSGSFQAGPTSTSLAGIQLALHICFCAKRSFPPFLWAGCGRHCGRGRS